MDGTAAVHRHARRVRPRRALGRPAVRRQGRLRADEEPREFEVPPALAAALAGDAGAQRAFDALAFTHRREYAEWIASAKRDETLQRRVAKALEMLDAGIKRP